MMILQIIISTTVILVFSENIKLVNLKLKDIRKITKNVLLESYNKSRGITQIGPKPGSYFDYPGLNIEKLNTNIRLWNLYTKCLEEIQKNMNKNKIFQAKVITTFKSLPLR